MKWIRYDSYVIDLDRLGSIRTYGQKQIELYSRKGKHIMNMYLDNEPERDRLFEIIIKQLPGQVKDLKDNTLSERS